MRERFAGVREGALNTDANPNIRPMTYYVETPQEIKNLFDNIAYAKGENGVIFYPRNPPINTKLQPLVFCA